MISIQTLDDIADRFGAIVLDQWGVLHDGTVPYPGAVECLERLHASGIRMAVLSNSGKRAAPNAQRIAAMGFAENLFESVMTSGEALWRDIGSGQVNAGTLLPIERAAGDAAAWADGLHINLTDDVCRADAILLMGLPDNGDLAAYRRILQDAGEAGLPILCTNPDRASPRAGGTTVVSTGALAHEHADAGGTVRFYGKPHRPVFEALQTALNLPPESLLMVGDSLEHDIAGGAGAGWSTLFVTGGLHAGRLDVATDQPAEIAALASEEHAPLPDYTLRLIG